MLRILAQKKLYIRFLMLFSIKMANIVAEERVPYSTRP
jgi:hypothetical protein